MGIPVHGGISPSPRRSDPLPQGTVPQWVLHGRAIAPWMRRWHRDGLSVRACGGMAHGAGSLPLLAGYGDDGLLPQGGGFSGGDRLGKQVALAPFTPQGL